MDELDELDEDGNGVGGGEDDKGLSGGADEDDTVLKYFDPPEDPTDVLFNDDVVDVDVGGSAGSSATNSRPRAPRGAGIGGRIGDEEGSDATDE